MHQTMLSYKNVENSNAPFLKKTVNFCVKLECLKEAKRTDAKVTYIQYPELTSVFVSSNHLKLKTISDIVTSNTDFTWIKDKE